ncbi:hypothetical protein HAX54_014762 [Datura stramonium]|uniref:Uncharacterized protein n=1 Tax=Datura stramonium TaxID=4076 RepID=A0ABS8TQJ5_DATST|nr:hypothetical protein [Datura stramonium]
MSSTVLHHPFRGDTMHPIHSSSETPFRQLEFFISSWPVLNPVHERAMQKLPAPLKAPSCKYTALNGKRLFSQLWLLQLSLTWESSVECPMVPLTLVPQSIIRLEVQRIGKRALIAGAADDNGYGWAIAVPGCCRCRNLVGTCG